MQKKKRGQCVAAKRRTSPKPTKTVYSALSQLVQWIPNGMIPRLAEEANLDIRKFSATSHVVALMYGQLSGCESLNGICDAARLHEGEWRRIRGAQPPCLNTFSNANRRRDPGMAEALYWKTFESLASSCPSFGSYHRHQGFLFRMKRDIYSIDSSTIKLVMNCFDWAKHRRKKAAAKLHMNLNVGTRLPALAIVEDAAHHDSVRAEALCAALKEGDVVVADRAYTDFAFLSGLNERGVFFVVRQKKNMRMKVKQSRACADKRILSDETVAPELEKSAGLYPQPLRRIVARVEVDGREMEMTFLTNNFEWSAWTITELYKARWAVELFFKELKQTCQIHDFVGYNENAVKWQIWIGLLVHLLLRFMKHLSKWGLSFSRLAGIVRSAIWVRRDLLEILASYGIAGPGNRAGVTQKPPHIQDFLPFMDLPYGTA